MGLRKSTTAAEPTGESSTFFAAASPKPKEEKPGEPLPNPPQVTPKDEPKKPARTFFDTGRGGYIDPLTELSTHRSGRALMSDDERAARKAAEEQRARRGLENLQAAMNRTQLIGK
ncbi:hypothetical protein [Paraburkholderia strydomiana]|uniref:hypothetical protein n=1 Tax=Paraburkholderia strydomiana TaxID=1245417 RepID=UPI0038B7A6C4